MKSCLSKIEVLAGLGFEKDPFKDFILKTGDATRVERLMKIAINSRSMISVVGGRGIGKTEAINAALDAMKAKQVIVESADKEQIRITDIEYALIYDLSEEDPKRGREIRARQVRRILGEASQKEKVVLVIEEAHRLHHMTLCAIKTLREMAWMGKKELMTVVMVGQSDPMQKRGVSEVRLRSDSIQMRGLTRAEVAGYIQATVGRVFTEGAVNRISSLSEFANFLELQEVLVCLMGDILGTGEDKVTEESVDTMFNLKQGVPTPKPTAKPKSKKADSVKSGNSTVSDILARRRAGNEPGKQAVNG